MKCLHCGGKMTSTRGAHRYTESGLSDVTLYNVEIRSCPECGEREIVIPKIEQLHRFMARETIKRPGRLEAEQVRFLRRWLGFSAADFASAIIWLNPSRTLTEAPEIALSMYHLTISNPFCAAYNSIARRWSAMLAPCLSDETRKYATARRAEMGR